MDILGHINGYNAEIKDRYDEARALHEKKKAAEERWQSVWQSVGRECWTVSQDLEHVPDARPFVELVSVLRERNMHGWLPDMLQKWQERRGAICWTEEGLILALLQAAVESLPESAMAEQLATCRTWPFGSQMLAEGADNIRQYFLIREQQREKAQTLMAVQSAEQTPPVADAETEGTAPPTANIESSAIGRADGLALIEPSEELLKSYHDPDNYCRNVWLYNQRKCGKRNPEIRAELRNRAVEFAPLETDTAIGAAIDSIAVHHGWPILKGQSGRPPGSKTKERLH